MKLRTIEKRIRRNVTWFAKHKIPKAFKNRRERKDSRLLCEPEQSGEQQPMDEEETQMNVIEGSIAAAVKYGQMMQEEPLPCPLHRTPPIVMVDITTVPHTGKALCRNVNCKIKAVAEPYRVIHEWNEKTKGVQP